MRTFSERNLFLSACDLIKQAGLIHTPFFSQMVKYIDYHPKKTILAQVYIDLFKDKFFREKLLLTSPKTLHSANQLFRDKIAIVNQILYVIAANENPDAALESCQLAQFKIFNSEYNSINDMPYHFKYSPGYKEALMTIENEKQDSLGWYFFLRMLILSHDSPKELAAAFVFLKAHHNLALANNNMILKKDNENLYKKVFCYQQPLKAVSAFILLNYLVKFYSKVPGELVSLFTLFKQVPTLSPRFFSGNLSFFSSINFFVQDRSRSPSFETELIKIYPLWMDLIFDMVFRTKYALEFSLIISKLTELGAWEKINPFEAAFDIFKFLPYWLKNPDFISFFPRLPQESKSLDLFGELLLESEKAFANQQNDCTNLMSKMMANISYQMRELADKYYDHHKFFRDKQDRPYYTLLMLFILEMQLKETPEILGLLTDAYLQLFDFSLLQMDNLQQKMSGILSPRLK